MQRCLLLSSLVAALLATSACQTTDSERRERPEITSATDITEAYQLARRHGGAILHKTKELAKSRKEVGKVHNLSEEDLIKNNEQYDVAELANVSNLYFFSSQNLDAAPLRALLSSRSLTAQRLGWRMAAIKPSPQVAQILEQTITKAMKENREDQLLFPEMALAIKENGMQSEYTFLVRGLMINGSPEFANAMLSLDPKRATDPFLNYLMRADLEDLRQMSQKSVNVPTCTVIFRFLAENPIPLSHPGVPSLFLFSVSRNRALADMANAVLEKHIPENRATFATLLSRLPVPVQVAFIENSQREMTANMRLLLSDLKEIEQHREVIEELNAPQAAGAQ